jgi:Transmembrane protein of unknown function (DUF3556)
MGFLKPTAPPYDPLEWEKLPFRERARQSCQAWALQGYGTPLAIYLLYALKVLFYVGAWVFFCGFTPGLGRLGSISSWWLEPVAFQKAILWSMLFEGLGLGCGSGPLTGRFYPPVGGFLYFLRPGTTKHSLFPSLPILGGFRRTWLDVLLYAGWMGVLLAGLTSAQPSRELFIAIAALVVVLGVTDKTIFLAVRAEHYWTTVMVFVLASNWIPGAKAVMLALWFWAGVSKLNHHFSSVVCVMVSNSPLTRFEWLRKRFYKRYPDDLTPSVWAVIAEGGTLLEFGVPILLFLGNGGTLTIVGLVCMVLLHTYITSNVPMGVPIEWNVMMVYGGFFLFWKNAGVGVLSMSAPVAAFLFVMLVAVPLLGNLFPSKISFLMAMRYYAGNWAYSVWLFRGESYRKLDKLKKSSPWIIDQLMKVGYDKRAATGVLSRLMAFRLMHFHGRALPKLIPKAVDRFEEYMWIEGEAVCGLVLGYNFGDGHLHNEDLLGAVQEQCGFEDGELRCIFVEAQPLGQKTLHYRIADAKTGARDQGHVDVKDLLGQAPWG